jgi:hypothetical protein
MELRTVAILFMMAFIVVATSAFGTYQDSLGNAPVPDNKTVAKAKVIPASKLSKELVGASGAGTSHKQSQVFLDISERADGPHVKDGANTYRGKAGGYDLRDTYDSDSDSVNSDESDGDDAKGGAPISEFQRKIKYIKNIFKEIFSKWGSNESVLAPASIEEQLDNPMGPEGFRLREKFRRGARQGMRKLKNAFRGRSSGKK